MLLHPYCKINLGLRIVSEREDGYHDLESVFYPIHSICDELEIDAADDFQFSSEGLLIDGPTENNLVVRAYDLVRQRFPRVRGAHIRLKKIIPFGAGLGGGSSDATHTVIALNRLYHLGLSTADIAAIVQPLGADCPFFAYDLPCLAEGIGEKLTPISFTLSGYRLILLKPEVAISTREAYNSIPLSADQPSLADYVRQCAASRRASDFDIAAHSSLFANDFENTVFVLHPQLAQLKQQLLDAGAAFASLTGSGSCLYGLFHDKAATTHRLSKIIPRLPEDTRKIILINQYFA